ncbi:MAG: DUF389 domain-containing protein [Ferruginibacter sp.]|nr:DUF389 domain-containing protein [Chitinophagaceae bacterium]MBP6287299.1 DUF389 domain-containing protein [Ferruginibacter sp.]MBU9935772.1 DUF389 domain-containing protein [Ferruginibacter sp.]HQY11704.1 DUF389 domain-containing protein [Ferruginibacter sp.]
MKRLAVLLRFVRSKFYLNKEEYESETIAEIKEGAYFSGHNLWILGFAMVIACIGLNTDSISAVIGAMLISPLMGPIVGFAFALAVNDAGLKNKSIRNWLWMTIISLLASAFFFLISPFDNNTTALSSFQKASIFDVLLAFFGGMAGFIGIIKKEGIKVIAGVAVATACMPPLCTAGFGIAHLDFQFFIGGLYFYLINCLFIGLATFLLTRFTGYHINKEVPRFRQTANWLWTLFIVAMIVPASYIAYKKWNEEHTKERSIMVTDKQRIEALEKKVLYLDSLLQYKKK